METEYQTCVSLTSEKDGSLRTECLSPDILSLQNSFKIKQTIPFDGDLQMNFKGTGYFVVAIHDGNTAMTPLYLLKLRHVSTVEIMLSLMENERKVKATFNHESFKISVDPENVQAELLVLTGNLTTDIHVAVNGKNGVLRQTFEMYDDEIEMPGLENVTWPSLNSSKDDMERNECGKIDDDDDDHDDVDDEGDDDDYDIYGNSYAKECNRSNYKEDESQFTGDDNSDVSGYEDVDDQNFDDSDKYTSYDDDDDDSGSDEELIVCETFEEVHLIDSEVSVFHMGDHQLAYTDKCRFCSQMIHAKQESVKYETVDIRANRTELLKTMRSDRLADYFFEASLISEDNMAEIHQLWRSDNRAANGCLLNILRNKKVRKHKIEAVLVKAEELHLLDLMFPKQSHFVTVSTQTDDLNWTNQVQAPEAQAILNSLRSPMLDLMFNRLC